MAAATRSTSLATAGSPTTRAARPCRRALRRTRALASAVRGPVLRCALRLLAVTLASEVMALRHLPLAIILHLRHLGELAVDNLVGGFAQASSEMLATTF